MKIKIVSLFSAFILITTLKAQIPGYQGKRFSVGYNVSTFVFSDDLSFGNIIDNARVSYKTELNVHYTLSRKITAGFSYYFANQKDYDVHATPMTYMTAGGFRNSGEYKMLDPMPAKIRIYEINFQFFRKNFIAPAGLYHQVGIGIIHYNLGTNDGTFLLNYYSAYLSYYQPQSQLEVVAPKNDYVGYKLSYHLGKTNPIGHRFYLNTAIGVNFFRGGDTAKIKTEITDGNYILYELNNDLRKHNFFEIKLGFGWMAF